ncbi:MAG: [FeFe] hydrogenase H-cluster radical SAM maturase HydE [Oscillospiraceae bacterium]|nr:[FeFe] hydrogenase H-cluster radical SAM maturase HydE [Oscillospiraceae bacterium]
MENLVEQLYGNRNLPNNQLKALLSTNSYDQDLFAAADTIRQRHYGRDVYIRGLIEISNYCQHDCYYCGIRCGNGELERYRLTQEEILACCKEGYRLGFRTFVMQSGDDPYFTDDVMCELITVIKREHGDCAITLSLGERSRGSYQALFNAGADRYLLRHETANCAHYAQLHPKDMQPDTRKKCLCYLKDIGFQVGSGFMVGSPYQTLENIIEDLRFLQELQPDMIGIGPFLSHKDTPMCDFPNGDLALTLRLISVLRMMFPHALIPATTALGTLDRNGRELGLRAGANVVMPNLSPRRVRKQYALYDNKIATGEEAAESRTRLETRVKSAGYEVVTARGDVRRV